MGREAKRSEKAKQNKTKEAKQKKQSEMSKKQYTLKQNEGKTAFITEAKRKK
jgi:hypothetical protein